MKKLSLALLLLGLLSARAAWATGLLMGAGGSSGFIAPVLPSYTGQVATRTFVPNGVITSFKQVMSRKWHYARVPITSLQIIIPNYYVDADNRTGGAGTGQELGSGGTATVTASVEYPVGTFTQIKFGGATSGTIASGTTKTSDAVSVTIPQGAKFFIRIFFTNATAVVYDSVILGSNFVDTPGGDATNFAASGLSDQTLGGTVTNSDATRTAWFGAEAIIATTTAPALCLAGDSRVMGVQDLPDATGDTGNIARSIGPYFAYINMGIPSDRAQWLSTFAINRAALFAYCSHLITEDGINDTTAGRTAVQIQGNLATIWSAFPSKPVFHVTYEPETTSTDSWATLGNQTIYAQDAVRVTMNTWTRGNPAGTTAVFDVASYSESSLNSGKWKVPSFTPDGVHPGNSTYVGLGSSGLIQPTSFVAPSCSQATTFLARTSGLNAAHQNAYTTMICGLVTDGVWTTGDVFYVFATADATTAGLNLISSSFAATVTGAPTFTADSGYVGGTLANHLGTYNPVGNATNFTQNSAAVAEWGLTNSNNGSSIFYNSTISQEIGMYPRFTDGRMYASLNSADDATGVAVSRADGFKSASRVASTGYQYYDAGVNLGTHTSTSTAIFSAPILIAGGASSNNNTNNIAVFWIGGGLSDPQETALYNRIHAYMQTIAGVP